MADPYDRELTKVGEVLEDDEQRIVDLTKEAIDNEHEIAELKGKLAVANDTIDQKIDRIASLESELAALREDKEGLDWLEGHAFHICGLPQDAANGCKICWTVSGIWSEGQLRHIPIREALDAARKSND